MEDVRPTLRASSMSLGRETNEPEHAYFADLESTKGRFTGQAIDYRLPCTASDDHTCQIAMQMSAWNEVFSYSAFDMRFQPGTSGKFCILGLPVHPAHPLGYISTRLDAQEVHKTSALLYWLLKTHRCISSINITSPFVQRIDAELLSEGIVASQSLRKLQLYIWDFKLPDKLCAAISALKMLEELVIKLFECSEDLTLALAALLPATISLTVLRLIIEDEMPKMNAIYICRAVCANKTLRELSLSGSMATKDCLQELTRFFRSSTTLTTLSITYWRRTLPGCLKDVLHAILRNRMVTNVTLQGLFIFDDESAQVAAQLLSAERRLRVFRVSTDMSHPRGETGIYDQWLVSIEKNTALEELGLPLSIWKLDKWKHLFAITSKARNLAKVFCSLDEPMKWVLSPDDEQYRQLLRICRALRESGAEEKIHFERWHLPISLDALECKAFSQVTLDCYRYRLQCCYVLQRLPSLRHINSVIIYLNPFKKEIAPLLAKYLGEATALRSLELRIFIGEEDSVDIRTGRTLVLESLSRNTSLKELNVAFLDDTEDQSMVPLANVISTSRNIRRVFISGNIRRFLRRLSVAGVEDSYTLLEVRLNTPAYFQDPCSWFVVSDTTRRNCDLVARAALCTNNSRSNRFHVSALERVRCYPALMEELADVLGAAKAEVAKRVRAVLRRFEGLHVFMRLAGVVKERVVCHPREDGRTQLSDLNKHCWSHARRYVMLNDIRK